MNILIIGSKGFIGSHCVSFFEKNHNVWGCDVVEDASAKNYFLVDAFNPDFPEIFKKNNFDVCINCSGAANISDSIENPQHDFTLNTMNVFIHINAIRKSNTNCCYINFSSAAVYGSPEVLPIVEDSPTIPISPYGNHKLLAEQLLKEFHDYYKVRTCSLRVFSAYGPGLKKQLFWDLNNKIKRTSSIELFGSGLESRDFIYIDDIMEILQVIIDKYEFDGSAINVASGEETTIKTAAETMCVLMGNKRPIVFNGIVKSGDPKNWRADISKLLKMGYQPKTSFREGLNNYVKWLR